MAGERIMRARAIISGKDDTGPAFNSIADKLERVSKKLEAIGRATGIAQQIEKTTAALQKQEAALRAIDRYRDARGRIDPLRQQLAERQAKVRELARAMDAVAAPSRKMVAEYNRAIDAARRADRAFQQQAAELAGARKGLADAGLKTGELAAAQIRLRRGIGEANGELQRQNRLLHQAAAAEEAMARREQIMERHSARHALATGAAAYVGGHSVLHGIAETAISGAHYQDARVGLLNTGLSPEELASAEEAARRTIVAVPTSNLAENLKVINETIGAFGSLGHAIEHLPFMQKAASVLRAAGDETSAGDMKNLAFSLAKIEEMRGRALNGAEFAAEGGDLVRAMAFFHGKFNPEEARLFGVQAKDAFKFLDTKYLTTVVPSIVAEVGGERAGTALNAFNTVLMGRIRDKKQVAEWLKYGLIDRGQVVGGAGSPISWRAGAVHGTALAQRDTEAWFKQVVFPALQAHGVDVNDPQKLGLVLSTLFRNQNSRYWAYLNADPQQLMQRDKDAALIDKTGSTNQMYGRNLSEGTLTPWHAMIQGVEDLATAVSSPAAAKAGPVMSSIASGLQELAAAAKSHPVLATGAGAVIGGAALAGSGYLAYRFLTAGTALTGAAGELSGAAAALTRAAVAQGGKGIAGDIAGAAAGAGGASTAAIAAGAAVPAAIALGAGWGAYQQWRTLSANWERRDYTIDPLSLTPVLGGDAGHPAGAAQPQASEWGSLGDGISSVLASLKRMLEPATGLSDKIEAKVSGAATITVRAAPGTEVVNKTSSGNLKFDTGTTMSDAVFGP